MVFIYNILKYINHLRTDIYVLSYPKCGRTWYRFMLGNSLVNAFNLKEVPLNDILMVKKLHLYHKKIPKIVFSHEDLPQWKYYKDIDKDKSEYKKKKVIFLIRDPRDLVVSNFYQKKYRGFKYKKGVDKVNFTGEISEFIRHEKGGLPNIIEYYNVWAKQYKVPHDFYLIKYEDLQSQPLEILQNTFKFFGLESSQTEPLLKAIEDSSFDKMREIEKNQIIKNDRLLAGSNNNEQSFKTRKGKIGSFKEELTDADIQWMEDYIKNHLDNYYQFYK